MTHNLQMHIVEVKWTIDLFKSILYSKDLGLKSTRADYYWLKDIIGVFTLAARNELSLWFETEAYFRKPL